MGIACATSLLDAQMNEMAIRQSDEQRQEKQRLKKEEIRLRKAQEEQWYDNRHLAMRRSSKDVKGTYAFNNSDTYE